MCGYKSGPLGDLALLHTVLVLLHFSIPLLHSQSQTDKTALSWTCSLQNCELNQPLFLYKICKILLVVFCTSNAK